MQQPRSGTSPLHEGSIFPTQILGVNGISRSPRKRSRWHGDVLTVYRATMYGNHNLRNLPIDQLVSHLARSDDLFSVAPLDSLLAFSWRGRAWCSILLGALRIRHGLLILLVMRNLAGTHPIFSLLLSVAVTSRIRPDFPMDATGATVYGATMHGNQKSSKVLPSIFHCPFAWWDDLFPLPSCDFLFLQELPSPRENA